MRESGVMRYELWGGGEDEWRAKMKARKGFLIFYCALLCEPGELSVSCEINFLLNYKIINPGKKKAKPTHVSAGLNRLYVSVFNYGVTAIIASN